MSGFRYQYTWSYNVYTDGGVDSDGYPIQATETPTDFLCDAQTDAGSYSLEIEGENFTSKYVVFIPLSSEFTFKVGDIVTDHNDKKFRVINSIQTKLNYEVFVG